MSLLIEKNTVVSFHYTLTNAEGDVLDRSEQDAPMTYLHGAGNIIPGLESALVGKTTGDQLKVTVAPEEGYGEKHSDLIQTVSRELFEGVEDIQAGMQFQAQSPDGNVQVIRVVGVDGDEITIDANHPLAGETLHFEVEITQVREAAAEELEHGHAH
ncbi:peptidylprolyl isomerase [Zooshikella marina]|uniref:Peptidyl-prolyl cis-trans isomerase n=1 Tax=Zooshikella ganghwensis TaxID=202772 RepID=A0A4P9VLI0_9GAMM|nr:peptidylprolyl isomerase [Zooshikella ganghwensis]MBU2707473.1 peptidylprolyl isomerase [Zooshikella ganghwensis]RDH42712.1 peptidylprolyl isomerase [Zooshikella ganghwensis]